MIETIKEKIHSIYTTEKSREANPSITVLRKKGAEIGITALDRIDEYGKTALTYQQIAEIFAFCGELDLDLRDLPGLGHGRIISCATNVKPEQKLIIDQICSGDEFIGVAITEEDGGSDLHGMKTVAKATENGYLISGKKTYIARLNNASQIVVFTKTENEDINSNLSAFIVPLNSDGLTVGSFTSMGLSGSPLGMIEFNNVFVPETMCIDQLGCGITLFNKHFSYWRTAMAAVAIGSARGAIKQALQWLTNRNAFGGSIGRFTHLQQELSKHTSNIRMAWLLTLSTMGKLDLGKDIYIQAAMTKAEALEMAIDAVNWSMQIHGAKGYTNELDLQKRLRDLLGLRIADGTTDVLRGQVARSLLGDELYEKSLGRSRTTDHKHPVLINEILYTA